MLNQTPSGESTLTEQHVDVVGSLLRPDRLMEARERRQEGSISPSEFKRIEDEAVDRAIQRQDKIGLPIVTDGELRRLSFQSRAVRAIDGLTDAGLDSYLWGQWTDEEGEEQRIDKPEDMGVTSQLHRRRSIAVEEFVYLRSLTDRVAKMTLPSPGLFLNFWDGPSGSGYSSLDEFMDDVIGILRDEIERLVELGCRYVQLDAPHYAMLLDGRDRSGYGTGGEDRDATLRRWIEWDNRVLERGSEITLGLHLCRGNQANRWLTEGSYGPLAPILFERLTVDRLLLEYDDERSGSFEPLLAVPDGVMVVLGLESTKRRTLTPAEDLERKVREAAVHHPFRRLAISPQCGFSSSVLGNNLDRDMQYKKLAHLVSAADRIW